MLAHFSSQHEWSKWKCRILLHSLKLHCSACVCVKLFPWTHIQKTVAHWALKTHVPKLQIPIHTHCVAHRDRKNGKKWANIFYTSIFFLVLCCLVPLKRAARKKCKYVCTHCTWKARKKICCKMGFNREKKKKRTIWIDVEMNGNEHK